MKGKPQMQLAGIANLLSQFENLLIVLSTGPMYTYEQEIVMHHEDAEWELMSSKSTERKRNMQIFCERNPELLEHEMYHSIVPVD